MYGGIGLEKIEGHKAEIGYWLAEKYWGKGVMTAAVEVVTKYSFEKLGLRRIYARVFHFNKASIRVLEKAGFEKEGLLKREAQKDGKLIDSVLYAKTR